MSKIETVSISKIRKDISDYFTDAVYNNKLVELSRHDKERAFLLGDKIFDLILKNNAASPEVQIEKENDGTITVIYKTLDLVANEETYENAIENIAEQAIEYANDYLEDMDIYIRDQERALHLPMIVLIYKAKTRHEIKNILGLIEENTGSSSFTHT